MMEKTNACLAMLVAASLYNLFIYIHFMFHLFYFLYIYIYINKT